MRLLELIRYRFGVLDYMNNGVPKTKSLLSDAAMAVPTRVDKRIVVGKGVERQPKWSKLNLELVTSYSQEKNCFYVELSKESY